MVDVGCGIGGSSRHIAKKFGCKAEGITLSPVQVLCIECLLQHVLVLYKQHILVQQVNVVATQVLCRHLVVPPLALYIVLLCASIPSGHVNRPNRA